MALFILSAISYVMGVLANISGLTEHKELFMTAWAFLWLWAIWAWIDHDL